MPNNNITSNTKRSPPKTRSSSSRTSPVYQEEQLSLLGVIEYTMQCSPQEDPRRRKMEQDRAAVIEIIDDVLELIDQDHDDFLLQ
jgi:hypothetical protein